MALLGRKTPQLVTESKPKGPALSAPAPQPAAPAISTVSPLSTPTLPFDKEDGSDPKFARETKALPVLGRRLTPTPTRIPAVTTEAAADDIRVVIARSLMRQCYEAALISQQEAVSLVPRSDELLARSLLAVIAEKVGEPDVATLQRKLCAKMGLPIFPHGYFPPAKRVPPHLSEALIKARLVPVAYEHTADTDSHHHGFITVAAEHHLADKLALEIATGVGVKLLMAHVVIYAYEGFDT